MIDALFAIIAYLAGDADLDQEVAGRIAAKHKFNSPETDLLRWPNPAKALQVSYDPGGTPDAYTGNEGTRLVVRCYAPSQEEASAIYNRLMAICDGFQRSVVTTGAGRALIYYLVPDSSPAFGYDPDVNIDFIQTFLKTSVARTPVP